MPSAKRRRRLSRKERVIEELAKYGITKEAIGPLVLGILIGIILSELGVAHELDSRVKDEYEQRVLEIRYQLRKEGVLSKIERAVTRKQFDEALNTIVRSHWAHYF